MKKTAAPKTPKVASSSFSYKKLFPARTLLLFTGIIFIFGFLIIFIGTHVVISYIVEGPGSQTASKDVIVPDIALLFPIGVDPRHKTITENPTVEEYFDKNISSEPLARRSKTNWLSKVLGQLSLFEIYQSLASPTGRILVIESGERKEEVASHFAKILGWNEETKAEFLSRVIEPNPSISEGKFAPGTFTTARDATAEDVAKLVNEKFQKNVLARYNKDMEARVPLDETLIIASLLEREAYDFTDMRQISGIIWNRLFANMNLQIDATLQYAKGTKSTKTWWPNVVPSDKYIDSAYNTYKNPGLPPAPIANPSLDAILAALNPRKTDCMYYFHDRDAGFHCSITYKEHVDSLKKYYGQGR